MGVKCPRVRAGLAPPEPRSTRLGHPVACPGTLPPECWRAARCHPPASETPCGPPPAPPAGWPPFPWCFPESRQGLLFGVNSVAPCVQGRTRPQAPRRTAPGGAHGGGVASHLADRPSGGCVRDCYMLRIFKRSQKPLFLCETSGCLQMAGILKCFIITIPAGQVLPVVTGLQPLKVET